MGLQLWLPLNGNIRNQGLCDVKIEGNPDSWENGKIGKCAKFNGGQWINTERTDLFSYTDNFTWACWIIPNYQSGTHWAFTCGRADYGGYGYGLQLWLETECKIWFGSSNYSINTVNDAWQHIAFTKRENNIRIYLNGECVINTTFVGDLPTWSDGHFGIGIGCFHYSGEIYHCNSSINDFRLYDECLSPKQVKYISQAMICHYPMGNVDGKIGGRNLILNGKGNKRAGFFKYFDTVTDQYGEVTLKSKWSYTGIDLVPGFVLGCRDYEVGAYYIWSYDIMYTAWNFPSGSSRGEFWIGQRYAGAPSGEDATGKWQFVTAHDLPVVGENGCKLNEWYHVKRRVLIPSQASSNVGTHGQIMFYNPSKNVEASFTARFRNVKLEKGTESTPWTPAPEDNSQFYDNIIPDISGYRNNATVKDSTSPTWSDDSPRYLGSYRFDATKEMFLNPIVFSGFADSYTFSWWGKNSQPDSSMYWGFIDGNRLNLYNTDGYLFWNIGDSQDNPFNDPVTTNKVSSYIDGKWHHYCVTGDGESNKLYVDGKIYGIAKTYRKITGTKIHINGWDDGANYKINGNISDFRIYATALSESDVLNLYQSSASLDSQGNLMLAGEVIE